MKIILIQGEETVRERVSFWLENTLQAKVVSVSSIDEAVVQIRDGEGKTHLVVFDSQKDALKSFRKFREEVGPTLPIILCLEGIISDLTDTEKSSRTQIVNRRKMIEGLSDAIVHFKQSGALDDGVLEGTDGTIDVDPATREFCKIRTTLLLSVIPLKGDVFIRLSSTKFLKIFKRGDHFDQNDFKRYFEQKKIEFFYLKKDAINEFVEKYAMEVHKLLSKVDDLKIIGQSEVNVHEIVQEITQSVGFTPAVEKLVRSQMRMTVESLEKNPGLKGILSKLEDLKGDYLHVHSVLSGHIACGLATEMSWANKLTYQKMTMAGFLHDITLDDGKIAKISTVEEFDEEARGPDVKKRFLEHPQKAAEIANQFHEIPPDVDKIILQHHELPNQSGFPHHLAGTRMFPLACLFIIGHEMADYHIENRGKKPSVTDFIQRASAKYEGSQYRKIIAAVQACFQR